MASFVPPPLTVDGTTIAQSGAGVVSLATAQQAASHFSAVPTNPVFTPGTVYQAGATAQAVMLACTMAAGNLTVTFQVADDNAFTVNAKTLWTKAVGSTIIVPLTFVVPAGKYYRMTATGTAPTIDNSATVAL